MSLQIEILHEQFVAVLTMIWLLSTMHAYVGLHILQLGVVSFAVVACEDLIMSFRLAVADAQFPETFVLVVAVLYGRELLIV